MATEQRGSRATLRHFRVLAPVWNQNVPSSHTAPTAVTCALPSSLTVDNQVVREFTASLSGADPESIFPTMADQSTGGRASAAPRFTISMTLPPSGSTSSIERSDVRHRHKSSARPLSAHDHGLYAVRPK